MGLIMWLYLISAHFDLTSTSETSHQNRIKYEAFVGLDGCIGLIYS